MARNLKIRDLTLRDGQQSSFATRMSQAQVDRCLPYYKDANFYAMEVWGGAVPDSVMRYLNENPWTRLETIHKAVGNVSKLTALSRGRNLFGYAPYPDDVIDGFCRNSIESGLGIMRIFDALNDVDNVKSTVKYVKQYGGIADCAVCYTVDPKYPEPGFFAKLMGRKSHEQVFTDAYFLDKAEQMAALGADMITIKDMSGLIPPRRVATLVKLFKKNIDIPVDFHTHCTPGYGLASVLAAIIAGVDVVDTNCWYFAEGTGAPAIELVHVFCKKLGVDTGVNMEAVAKINTSCARSARNSTSRYSARRNPNPKRSIRSPTRCPPRSTRCSTRRSRPLRPTTRPRRSTPAARSRLTSASRLPTNWCRRPRFPAACIRTWWPSSSSSRPRRFCPAPWS